MPWVNTQGAHKFTSGLRSNQRTNTAPIKADVHLQVASSSLTPSLQIRNLDQGLPAEILRPWCMLGRGWMALGRLLNLSEYLATPWWVCRETRGCV